MNMLTGMTEALHLNSVSLEFSLFAACGLAMLARGMQPWAPRGGGAVATTQSTGEFYGLPE